MGFHPVSQQLTGIAMVPVIIFNTFLCFFVFTYYEHIFSKIPFYYYTNYRKYSNKPYNNSNLFYYLAGLLEGDGNFNIPKELKTSSGKSSWASIEVVFALKDQPSAEYLKNIFGGNVYKRKDKNCVRWLIQDRKSLIYIVNSINGKLRTPKIHAFYRLIDFLNLKGDNIIKLPLDISPLYSNAWLAGFIDSDGCFSIKGFTSGEVRTYIRFQFYLPQRAFDISGQSLEPFMQSLANFLKTNLGNRKLNGVVTQFIVNTSNTESNTILVNYLNNFPLFSSKYLDFKIWEESLSYFIKKLHRDPMYLEKIRELKSNMNTKRTKFNWDHHKNDIYKV